MQQSCAAKDDSTPLLSMLGLFWLASFLQGQMKNDLFFFFFGKPLDDEARLSDYGVREGSVLSVLGRVRGGCFMLSATVFTMLCASFIGSFCTCGLSLVAVPFLLPLLFILPLFCL